MGKYEITAKRKGELMDIAKDIFIKHNLDVQPHEWCFIGDIIKILREGGK